MSFSSSVKMKKFIFGVAPYNPFNYFLESKSLYLETGMLDWNPAGFSNYLSYLPGQWYFDTRYTQILGNLSVGKKSDSSIEVRNSKFTVNSSSPIESKALGCDTKSKSVIMVNPTGGLQGLVQSSQIQMEGYFFPNGGVDTWTSAENLVTNNTNYTNGGLLSSRTLTSDNIPSGPFGIGFEFSEEVTATEPIFCETPIIFRKWCQAVRPATLFPGKLRLLVQSFYGSDLRRYTLDAESGALIIGINQLKPDPKANPPQTPENTPELDSEVNKRTTSINAGFEGSDFLITDENNRYFLGRVTSEGLWINYLQTDAELSGDFLRQYLNGQASGPAPSNNDRKVYETYLLSTLLPTRWMLLSNSEVSVNQVYTHGTPLAFGWKPTWDGKTLSIITRTKLDHEVFETVLWTMSININNFEGLLTDWTNGVYGVAEEGNIFSESFYTALELIFNVTVFSSTRSEYQLGYNILDIQYNKIWLWDEDKGKYKWDVPYDPFFYPLERYPENPDAPLYCWYDKEDNLVIVNYKAAKLEATLNFSSPVQPVCGPGQLLQCSITRSQIVSYGFTIDSYSLISGLSTYNSGFFATSAFAEIQAGSFENQWARSTGVNFCDGFLLPKSAACLTQALPDPESNDVFVQYALGTGPCVSLNCAGEEQTLNSLIIPQYNSEAVFIGNLHGFFATGTLIKGLCEAVTRAKGAWYCSFSTSGCNEHAVNSTVPFFVFDTPCNSAKFGDLSDKIIYGPGRDGGGGAHTDDCWYRSNQPCGIEMSSVQTNNVSWGSATMYQVNETASDMNGSSITFYVAGKIKATDIFSRSGTNSLNIVENCQGLSNLTGNSSDYEKFLAETFDWREWFAFLDLDNPYTSAYLDFRESAINTINYGIGGDGFFTTSDNPFFKNEKLIVPKSFVGAI